MKSNGHGVEAGKRSKERKKKIERDSLCRPKLHGQESPRDPVRRYEYANDETARRDLELETRWKRNERKPIDSPSLRFVHRGRSTEDRVHGTEREDSKRGEVERESGRIER